MFGHPTALVLGKMRAKIQPKRLNLTHKQNPSFHYQADVSIPARADIRDLLT
jgi:hypothetical protein